MKNIMLSLTPANFRNSDHTLSGDSWIRKVQFCAFRKSGVAVNFNYEGLQEMVYESKGRLTTIKWHLNND